MKKTAGRPVSKPRARPRAAGVIGGSEERRFQLVVEAAPNAMIMVGKDGNITLVNAQTERLFGYRRQELLGKTIEMLVPKRFRRAHPGHRGAFFASPQTRAMGAGRDLFGERQDGREVPIEIGLNPIETEEGLSVLVSIIDITERKRAEAALHATAASLKKAQEIAHLGSFERDFKDPSQDHWSDETFRIFGLDPAQGAPSLTEAIRRRIHPEDRGHVEAVVKKAVKEGSTFELEFRVTRPDGSLRYVRSTAEMLRGKNGRTVKMLGTVQDITERRVMERKLAHTEALASIGGMAAVVGESQRLNRTLEDFLQFARPRKPKMEVGDLNTTVREVLSSAKAERDIIGETVIEEVLDERLPLLPHDPDLVRQVLWNIVRNAFQALNGRGRLEVKTEVRLGEAVIHVQDSGPGIPRDQLDKVFAPFHTTKAKGTGLGLPISRNIIRAHGGDILIQSAPGRGSRFSIVLPLAR